MIPLQLKLIAGAALALAIAATLAWGLYWRGEYRELKVRATVLEDQVKVLAGSVQACSAGVELAKKNADAAIASGRAMLAEARRLHAGGIAQVTRLEALLERPAPAGAGCDQAWDAIEKARAPR